MQYYIATRPYTPTDGEPSQLIMGLCRTTNEKGEPFGPFRRVTDSKDGFIKDITKRDIEVITEEELLDMYPGSPVVERLIKIGRPFDDDDIDWNKVLDDEVADDE